MDVKNVKIIVGDEDETELVPLSCRSQNINLSTTPIPISILKHPPLDEHYKPKSLKSLSPGGEIHLHTARSFCKQLVEETDKPDVLEPRSPELETRVMVLYTGGTIGMKTHDGVYSPEPDYLLRVVRELPHLNDQLYVNEHYGHMTLQPCCLPPVKHTHRRILYWMFEYEPLLDSSNMTFDDWIRIAKDIYKSYSQYNGFVVLHGTDTLAYTASALSFMLESLGKPVVITGAQIPVCEVRSDGRENFVGALIVAGSLDIPEVTVCFNNKIIRGNRSSKTDNSSLDAFHSPNISPLAELNIDIKVDWQSIFRSPKVQKLKLHLVLNRNVGILRIFPSITVNSVRAFLSPPMEGVVLQTYGSGNMPSSRTDILDALREASNRGVIIINCSQCHKGMVDVHYATGQVLAEIGVIYGSDMTPEAALTKLAYVLGVEDINLEKKKKMMRKNLRGEMSRAMPSGSALKDLDILPSLAKFLRVSSSEEMKVLKEALLPPLTCYAAQKNKVDLLEQLKDSGANLSGGDYDQRTPIHIAAGAGQIEAVEYLLEHGSSVHAKDRWEETPLLCAVHGGHIQVVNRLVHAGAHPTLGSLATGVELCVLVAKNDMNTLKCWHSAGFNINASDYDGRTALHVACSRGLIKMVQLLLECGSDPLKLDNFERNALDEAKIKGHDNIVQIITRYMQEHNLSHSTP